MYLKSLGSAHKCVEFPFQFQAISSSTMREKVGVFYLLLVHYDHIGYVSCRFWYNYNANLLLLFIIIIGSIDILMSTFHLDILHGWRGCCLKKINNSAQILNVVFSCCTVRQSPPYPDLNCVHHFLGYDTCLMGCDTVFNSEHAVNNEKTLMWTDSCRGLCKRNMQRSTIRVWQVALYQSRRATQHFR